MRIALVCDWYSPRRGGIEAHLAGLGTRLSAAGHSVHVVTSSPGPGMDGSVTVHRLDTPRLPFAHVAIDPGIAGRITDVLQHERIDVVHAHVSIVAPVGLAAGLVAHRLGLPAVVTFHSFVPGTPLWARLAGLTLGASRWSAMMTAVSSRVVREVRAFAPAKPFRILPNAVDADFWVAGPAAAPRTGCLTLVYSGRLQSKKRPALALDAFAELRRVHPTIESRLVFCGAGPLEAALRLRASRLGLSDLVRFAGWQDAAALRDVLRGADLFLAPTQRESFGLAALEARAVGLPIVGMRDSGVADFITHGTSGLLASSDRDFVESVRTLALDAPTRESMRAHNVTVRPTLTWDHAIRNHLDAYEGAMRAAQVAA
jgi:glycosyltransferase involved in cell wall biosynthesis